MHTQVYTRYWVANDPLSSHAPCIESISLPRDLVYLRHRMKQNGANFGAHRRHVSKSFQRTEGTGEKGKLIKFALDKIVDLTRIVELPCHLMRPKTV